MSQADYYPNGNNSACGTIHSQLSTLNYYTALSGLRFRLVLLPTPLGRAIILTPFQGHYGCDLQLFH
ncbi:MAG: hypothetical protein LBE12_03595 [Planctomycetaceae bacterium]|nr:hypothetical protein [Planctomycetaceae bacterium]